MSLPHAILGVLSTGPRHARAVARTLTQLLDGIRPVNAGQVYATLERLTRQQRVTVARGAMSSASGSTGRTYALLPAGQRELQRWLEHATVEPALRCGFVERLVVLHALRDTDGLARLTAARRARVAALRDVVAADGRRPRRVVDVVAAGRRGERLVELARLGALRLLAAELAWLDDVERTLVRPAQDVTERIDARDA
jgi:DNA-binding PadR family transcriptional regulator